MNVDACLKVGLLTMAALTAVSCGKEESAQQYMQRGMALYDEGNLVKAQLEFKNVLQIDPKDAGAWFLLAKIAEQQQEWRGAYSAYSKAVELAPDNLEARIKLGTLLLAGNNAEEALEQADAVLAANAQDPAGLALRGAVRLRQGDTEAALADAQAALQQAPEQREALALLTQIRIQQDDLPAARQTLETALEAHPDDLRLMLALAGVSERLGDAQGTTSLLRQMIEREPTDLAHRTRLAQYLAASGQADAAEQVLRDAVDAMPGEVAPRLQLVQFLSELQDGDAAASALQGFIAADPDNHELRFALATLRIQAGDSEQAQQVYRELIALDGDGPSGLRARGKLAALLLGQGQADEARALAAEVLAKDDQDTDALLIRAAMALQDKDADQAVADLRTILKNQPELVGALRLLAQAHVAREELALAEDALQKAIELAPDDPAAYLQLAGLRSQTGDPDGAGLILEQLLSRDADSALAQTALAQAQNGAAGYRRLGQDCPADPALAPGASARPLPERTGPAAPRRGRGQCRAVRDRARERTQGRRATWWRWPAACWPWSATTRPSSVCNRRWPKAVTTSSRPICWGRSTWPPGVCPRRASSTRRQSRSGRVRRSPTSASRGCNSPTATPRPPSTR